MAVQTMQIAWQNNTGMNIRMFVAHRIVRTYRGGPDDPMPRSPKPPNADYTQNEYPESTGYESTGVAANSSFSFTVAYEDSGPYIDYWYVAIQLGPGSDAPAYSAGGATLLPQALMKLAPASTVKAWITLNLQGNPVVFLRPDGYVPPRVGAPPLYAGLPMTKDPTYRPWPTLRKSVTALSPPETAAYVNAVLALKQWAVSQLQVPTTSRYDDYVYTHMLSMYPITVYGEVIQNGFIKRGPMRAVMWAHDGPQFVAWHREFLHRFELDLQTQLTDGDWPSSGGYRLGIPYWDWTVTGRSAGSAPWLTDFMGGDGDNKHPGEPGFVGGTWGDLNKWPLYLTDNDIPLGSTLERGFGRATRARTLPVAADVTQTLSQAAYDQSPWNSTYTLVSFRNELEGFYSPTGQWPGMHNRVHAWVGGSMDKVGSSPNEPAFFLHHANIDRLWAAWQRQHPDHPAAPYLPRDPVPGTWSLDQPMQFADDANSAPWTAPPATPADVVSNLALNYAYDDIDQLQPGAE